MQPQKKITPIHMMSRVTPANYLCIGLPPVRYFLYSVFTKEKHA